MISKGDFYMFVVTWAASFERTLEALTDGKGSENIPGDVTAIDARFKTRESGNEKV